MDKWAKGESNCGKTKECKHAVAKNQKIKKVKKSRFGGQQSKDWCSIAPSEGASISMWCACLLVLCRRWWRVVTFFMPLRPTSSPCWPCGPNEHTLCGVPRQRPCYPPRSPLSYKPKFLPHGRMSSSKFDPRN